MKNINVYLKKLTATHCAKQIDVSKDALPFFGVDKNINRNVDLRMMSPGDTTIHQIQIQPATNTRFPNGILRLDPNIVPQEGDYLCIIKNNDSDIYTTSVVKNNCDIFSFIRSITSDAKEVIDSIIYDNEDYQDDSEDDRNSSFDDVNLPQIIYYGAPGTGKSRGIKDQESKFDEVIRTTFHPDTDYSTFVGAYKPVVENVDVKVVPVVLNNGASFDQNNGTYKEKKITYKFVKQSFLKAYISAWKGLKSDKKVLLDIEEINRGNCAQIFGDIFQLLDREVEGKMVGYSTYPIEADEDIANLLNEEFKNSDIDLAYIKDGSKLLLPPNLYIWATMNTSDQSLFPIDSAFKRRWDWKYVPIKYSNTDWRIVLGDKMYSWVSFQEEVNKRIKDATDGSEDKQMGDYFVNVKHKGGIIDSDLLLNKIAFYLWNDVCKDGDGDIFKIVKDDKAEDITFSQLFEDSTIKLQQWMKYLKVDPYSDPNNNVSVQNQENIESANDEIN